MFAWIRERRRRGLAKKPFPAAWQKHLKARVPFHARLNATDRQAFEDRVKVFVWEKQFLGAKGLEVTEEMRVVIAAAAARLVLRLDLSYYDRLSEIVVYPYDFVHPGKEDDPRLGETHEWGVVVLSWPAVWKGLKDPEREADTATHEFAHVLDQADGGFDGTPALGAPKRYRPWAKVMSEHFLKLRKGNAKLLEVLDDYGATDEAEFFAVATEAFYGWPDLLRGKAPKLYGALRDFYKVDPEKEWGPYP